MLKKFAIAESMGEIIKSQEFARSYASDFEEPQEILNSLHRLATEMEQAGMTKTAASIKLMATTLLKEANLQPEGYGQLLNLDGTR